MTAGPEVIPESTTAATPTPTTVLGDLAIVVAMQKPPCDGSYITVVASAVMPAQYAQAVSDALSLYPGSAYLRTDQTCPSLRAALNGNPIYSVYFGPYPNSAQACSARAYGPADAYVRRLSTTDTPDHVVKCN